MPLAHTGMEGMEPTMHDRLVPVLGLQKIGQIGAKTLGGSVDQFAGNFGDRDISINPGQQVTKTTGMELPAKNANYATAIRNVLLPGGQNSKRF